jgi:hypothetical protein
MACIVIVECEFGSFPNIKINLSMIAALRRSIFIESASKKGGKRGRGIPKMMVGLKKGM